MKEKRAERRRHRKEEERRVEEKRHRIMQKVRNFFIPDYVTYINLY